MAKSKKRLETESWDIEETEESGEHEEDVITYEINYYPSDLTLKGYWQKWKDGQLYVPPFQRNYVWDQSQASKLIESFLIGLPVPGVFLYKERKSSRLQIIDGQQRIFSAIKFFENDFDGKPFKLKNVQEKWEGKTYPELQEADRYQLQDTVLRATVVQQIDPDDDSSIYHIFERLNTGGIKLNPMEIRKCVYLGDLYTLLEILNTIPAWRQLIGQPKIDKRLRDVEFILRILALHENVENYEKPMKNFLNTYMISKKKISDKELTAIKNLFTKTSKFVLKNLGAKPFHLRGRLNYAVMDSTMSSAFEAQKLKVTNFKKRYEALINDKDYFESATINTSDEKTLKLRFKLAKKYLTK